MKRLTISVRACTETLGFLIAVAWADGRLDDSEKDGVRGAAQVLNLGKDARDRLEQMLETRADPSSLALDALTTREKAFAYVAGAWMARVDGTVDPEEQKMLDEMGGRLGFSKARQAELGQIAQHLEPLPSGARSWSSEISRLFKAIPPQLEEPGDDFEVVFE